MHEAAEDAGSTSSQVNHIHALCCTAALLYAVLFFLLYLRCASLRPLRCAALRSCMCTQDLTESAALR